MKLFILSVLVLACNAIDFDCLKGPNYWCESMENAKKCGRLTECLIQNKLHVKPKETKTRSKSVSCEICVEVVKLLEQQLFSKFTKQDFINFLNNDICEKIEKDTLKASCKVLANEYGPIVYDLLKSETPEEICKLFSACGSFNTDVWIQKLNRYELKLNDACTACKEVFKVLQELFSTISPDVIKQLLKSAVCNTLPNPLKDTCNSLVDNYTDMIFQLILSVLDGDRICPFLHLCAIQKRVTASWSCQTCLDVIPVLRKDLAGVSDSDIENFIDNLVCSRVPLIFRSLCNDAINKGVPQFMTELRSSMSPAQICAQNNICTSKHVDLFALLGQHSKLTTQVGSIECEACKLVITEVKKFISDPSIQSNIKNFIKNDICPIFKTEATKCQQIVDEFFTIAINTIIAELDADKVCTLIRMCTGVSQSTNQLFKNVQGSGKCEICQLIVNDTIWLLNNPQVNNDIQFLIKKYICAIFGAQQQQCETDIDEYYSIVINLILAYLKPSVCSDVGLCPSIVKHIPLLRLRNPDFTDCQICKKTYKYMKSVDLKQSNNQLILNAIMFCNNFNHQKKKCLLQYRDFSGFITVFKKSKDGNHFCQMMKLCESSHKNLGENPCSQGPAFWCSDRKNAVNCGPGAVKHCEFYVWSRKNIL